MTDRGEPTGPTTRGGWEWLKCPDCDSDLHEVWYGQAPNIILSVEVAHDDTCPAYRAMNLDGRREVAIAFLPKTDAEGES